MFYILKIFLNKILGIYFAIKELALRKNIILTLKIVGISRMRLGKKVYISEHVRVISEEGGRIEIGDQSKIGTMSIVEDRGGFIKIGKNTSINSLSVLYGHGGLTIGDNVRAATQLIIVPANHNFSDPNILISEQGETKKGIIIGDDVWLGARVTILDGVEIGHGSVVGAGSVVTSDIPPYSVAVGVPAKVIRERKI